jgi:carbon monoxide dehydrogenase subunit G
VTSLEVQKDIRASSATVWEMITDLSGSADVISGIESVEMLTEGPFAAGSKWRETRSMFGKRSTEEMEVTEINAGTSYVVEAEGHGARYRSVMSVIPLDDATCRLSMTFAAEPTSSTSRFFASTLGKMFEGGTKKALQQDLDDIAIAAQAK